MATAVIKPQCMHSRLALACPCGVSAGVVLSAAAAAQGQADCKVPGFSFRQGQIPVRTSGSAGVVGVLTLPYKPSTLSPNLATTAAACLADSSCAMFTSDGYLIAVFKAVFVTGNKDERVTPGGDTLGWKQMHYCGQPCCGTWVAEGAFEQVLAPLSADTPGSSGQGSVRTVKGIEQLPRDRLEGLRGGASMEMNKKLIDTACAGKEYEGTSGAKLSRIPAACPQHCRVACCKQLSEGSVWMAQSHFDQCSISGCASCYFGSPVNLKIFAQPAANLLMRQYLRAKAAEAAGAPALPQQSKTG